MNEKKHLKEKSFQIKKNEGENLCGGSRGNPFNMPFQIIIKTKFSVWHPLGGTQVGALLQLRHIAHLVQTGVVQGALIKFFVSAYEWKGF